jgi:hypothetical protein
MARWRKMMSSVQLVRKPTTLFIIFLFVKEAICEPFLYVKEGTLKSFCRIDTPAKLKPKEKHPYKVHMWAGISCRGTTNMAIFTGIMHKEFYMDTILEKYLVPYITRVFPDGNYRFLQDNDPKHKS